MEKNKEHIEKLVEILDAHPDDIPSILEVQKETWIDTYPNIHLGIREEDILAKDFTSEKRVREWREAIEKQGKERRMLVAKNEEGAVVGFCSLARGQDRNELKAIYVLPEYQGGGIGGKFMREAIEWFGDKKDIYLEAAKHNIDAIEFYEKCGFKRINTPVEPYPLPHGKKMESIGMIKKGKLSENEV